MGKHSSDSGHGGVLPESALEQTLSDYVLSPVNNEPDCCTPQQLADKVSQIDNATPRDQR